VIIWANMEVIMIAKEVAELRKTDMIVRVLMLDERHYHLMIVLHRMIMSLLQVHIHFRPVHVQVHRMFQVLEEVMAAVEEFLGQAEHVRAVVEAEERGVKSVFHFTIALMKTFWRR
jgi:hypothetical protein